MFMQGVRDNILRKKRQYLLIYDEIRLLRDDQFLCQKIDVEIRHTKRVTCKPSIPMENDRIDGTNFV